MKKGPAQKLSLVPIPARDRRDIAPAAPQKPAVSALAGFVSDNTKRAYGRDLKDFFGVDDLATVPMSEILRKAPEDVAAFRDLLLSKEMKPSTVARKLAAIRGLYNHLMARGVVQVNPADTRLVKAPKRPTIRKTLYLSWDEMKAVLRAPDRDTEIGQRDYALMLLDVNTGLRRSELCHLRDGDVVRQDGTWSVRLRGKGGKERFVPIRELVQEAIRGWQKVRPRNSEWLFTSLQGARFSEHQFWKATKRYALQALGAEGQRKVHPHALRAAFIKFQLDKGTKVDVLQQLVGHSRGDTTLGYVREIELLKSGADRALDGLDGD